MTLNTPKTNPNYWNEIDEMEEHIKNGTQPDLSSELKSLRIKNAIIDLTKPIKAPPMLISGGVDHDNEIIPVMTEGNFSAIVGLSKSRKSFFKTAIISTYMGGEFGELQGHRRTDKYIIDVDTEQSRYHCQRMFKRTELMAGYYPKYIPVSLREYEPKDRLEILADIVEVYKGNIGLISIDGYADLIDNFNDINQSTKVINALMKWTTRESCHITGVIHLNPSKENAKPQGHLGSFVLRKCETVITVEKDRALSKVKCSYSRNGDFNDFDFSIKKGLPISQEAVPY